jgi:hypothetical protein
MEKQMPLFNEKEILAENQHKQKAIKDMPLNTSFGFYFDNTADKSSQEYGDFVVCQGLEVDLGASSVAELIDTATPISFIPNTLLTNKMDTRAMITGEVYRIEKVWDRHQKFKDGTRAKGYGYALFHQEVGPQIKAELAEAYKNKISGALNVTETPAEPAEENTNRPAV